MGRHPRARARAPAPFTPHAGRYWQLCTGAPCIVLRRARCGQVKDGRV